MACKLPWDKVVWSSFLSGDLFPMTATFAEYPWKDQSGLLSSAQAENSELDHIGFCTRVRVGHASFHFRSQGMASVDVHR